MQGIPKFPAVGLNAPQPSSQGASPEPPLVVLDSTENQVFFDEWSTKEVLKRDVADFYGRERPRLKNGCSNFLKQLFQLINARSQRDCMVIKQHRSKLTSFPTCEAQSRAKPYRPVSAHHQCRDRVGEQVVGDDVTVLAAQDRVVGHLGRALPTRAH